MSNEYSRYLFMAFCIIWAIFCQQQVWWSSVGRFLTGALVSGKAKHEREVRKKSGTWQSLKTSHFPTTLKAHKLDRQLNRTTFMEAEIDWTTETKFRGSWTDDDIRIMYYMDCNSMVSVRSCSVSMLLQKEFTRENRFDRRAYMCSFNHES